MYLLREVAETLKVGRTREKKTDLHLIVFLCFFSFFIPFFIIFLGCFPATLLVLLPGCVDVVVMADLPPLHPLTFPFA